MSQRLDVRLDGYPWPIGTLDRDDLGRVTFSYSNTYAEAPNAIPLSLSLPLQSHAFDDPTSRFFFENLLQERETARADIMARYRLAGDDIVGILSHLGRDCTGAVSVLPQGAPASKVPGDLATDYDPISDDRLVGILAALQDRRSLPEGTKDPSPLAGVQSKIALTKLSNGRYAEPKEGSGAPTTHILKVPSRNRKGDARLEAATLALSRRIGLPTATCSVEEYAGIEILVVERFDRQVDDQGRIVRRHQEDFCQALGLSPRQKYQRDGTASHRFDAQAIGWILNQTRDPAVERRRFIEATIFDLLTGNVDGHAKNFSLFHLPGGRTETTPRYDLVPTRLDPSLTDELAYQIGEAKTLDAVSLKDFQDFLVQLGIKSRAAGRRLTHAHVKAIAHELDGQLKALHLEAGKSFADLVGANIRTLLTSLNLSVPPHAASRDAFASRAGGWQTS